MNKAQREIMQIVERHATGKHAEVTGGGVARYAEEFIRDIDAVVARYGVNKEVVKTFANGLQQIRITDQAGEVVAEYTDGPQPKTGRPPIANGEQSTTLTFRLTAAQRAKIDGLGGADWLRKQIDWA